MKKIYKNKKVLIITSSVLVVILICSTIFCFTKGKRKTIPDVTKTISSEEDKNIVIDDPDSSLVTDDINKLGEIEDDGNALKPDEKTQDTKSRTTGAKAEKNDTPKTEVAQPVKEPENSNSQGIAIGGNPPNEEKYDCGCANHHCQNAEAHAALLNRELEGCPYCGSHSCPSFYAINEWGYTYYDPTLCPKYNEKTDETKYCPDCGKPLWSKDNPHGCFRYLQDTQCECGEFVKANTCHHH